MTKRTSGLLIPEKEVLMHGCFPLRKQPEKEKKKKKRNDTHSKCYCSTNYVDFIFAPLLLNKGTLCKIHITMVKCCLMPIFLKIKCTIICMDELDKKDN